jgi:hypothetical protein
MPCPQHPEHPGVLEASGASRGLDDRAVPDQMPGKPLTNRPCG